MTNPEIISPETEVADLFVPFERLETCRRVEVTLDNLHILAQYFGGTAIYSTTPSASWAERKPRVEGTRHNGTAFRAEVGSWIDESGSRWNPEPLTQGWVPAGTYTRTVDGGPR